MKKFRKKPVVIEAVQWKGFNKQNWQELYDFCKGADGVSCLTGPHPNDKISIETLEGTMFGNVDDFIIKGVNGEFYPCKPDIFLKTYDAVTEE